MNIYFKKIILSVFALIIVFLSLITPSKVYALDLDDPFNMLNQAWSTAIEPALSKAGAVAWRNAINLYLGKIARESAEWVATGGKGQKPTFITNPGDYLTNVGDEALGEFIDQTAQSFTGKSLCEPWDPTIKFNIIASFDPQYKEMSFQEELNCPFSKIKERYKEARDQKLFEFSFDIREGPVGKYKSNVSNLLAGDTVLNKADVVILQSIFNKGDAPCVYDSRGFFKGRGYCEGSGSIQTSWVNPGVKELLDVNDAIASVQEDYQEILQNIQEDKYSSIRVSKNDLDFLKVGLYNINVITNLISVTNTDNKIQFSSQPTYECINKDISSFCSSSVCYKFAQWSPPMGSVCENDENNYKAATIYAERANKYVKQLVDWGNTLSDMIEQSMPGDEMTSLPDLDPLEDLERMYTPEGSAIGAQITLQSDLTRKITDEVNNSEFWKGQVQGRMNDLTTTISNVVKTPSTYIDESVADSIRKSSSGAMEYTGVAVADAFGIFTDTLVQKMLEQAFKKGINPNPSPSVSRGSNYLSENMPDKSSDQNLGGEAGDSDNKQTGGTSGSSTGSFTASKEESEALFSGLTTPTLKRGNEFTIYDEFTVCPEETNYTTTFNCIIGNGLLRAIEDNYTIRQAMEKGLINPGAIVGQPNDYTSQFSYPVIKKLRRARIFPLGLEIAAYKIFNGEAEPATLKEIVEGFNQGTFLSNGDLEKYADEKIPVGWNLNGSAHGQYGFDNDSYTGDYSYNITTTPKTSQAGVWYGIRSNKIYIQAETTYSISARIKLNSINGDSFGLRVHCNKDDGTGDNFQYTWNDSDRYVISKSSSWQEVSGTFTTNSEADYCEIMFTFGNGGTGNVNIDSVKMVKGESISENYEFEKTSQFYHLVDPGWLLKAPSYKCGAMAYSSAPLPETTQRQKACVDLKDCIKENDSGDCLSYSYCTREKNTWDFNGQSCPSQFGSCDTYIRETDGKTFSYLTNTLDFAGCDSTNTGCTWYCNQWSQDRGTWKCISPGISLDYESGEEVESLDNTLFLTSNAEECLPSAMGCNEYIDMLTGNLIYNGGFETIKRKEIEGWNISFEEGKEISNDAFDGDIAMTKKNNNNYSSQDVFVIGNSDHVLNFVAKTDNNKEMAIRLRFYDNNGNVLSPSSNNQIDSADTDGWSIGCNDRNCHIIKNNDLTDRYRSYSFNFKTPEDAQRVKVSIGTGTDGDGSIFVDQVSLFNGLDQRSYSSYANQDSKIYLQNPEECQSEDVGCELFTNQDTGLEVPAVVSEEDKCPSECIGYNSFLEMPTSFDLVSSWENFIPSTGEQCSSPGCESFTNLATVEQGGESREHYSYLRQCLILSENSDNCSDFYTWTGSDTAGYQLKRYQLKKSGDGGPDRNDSYQDAQNKWGECENETDLLNNPHCKQFYDSNGNKYFRLYENTISCSDDCVKYRRDKDGEEYMGLPEESESCSENNLGCKEYKGVDASSAQRIIFDDFEDGSISFWESGEDSILSISNEAINFPGHSLGISPAGMGTDRRMIFYDVSELIDLNESYDINFWVKGTSSITVGFSSLQEKTVTNINPDEWYEVNLGPFIFNDSFSSDEKLRIESATDVFYIDNVVLKASSSIKLIEDSWQTPETCSLDVVGCSAYTDKNDNTYYLNSFSHLCESSQVGCSAFIDTKNYESPYQAQFNTSEDSVIRVEEDEIAYLVDNDESRCQSSNKGCQRLGEPSLDSDGSVIGWDDVYFKNNPDEYEADSIVCQNDELGCQAYEGGYYFKDPEQFNKVCEYREDVLVYGQGTLGWFKKGTNEPCYIKEDGTAYKSNDVVYGILGANEEAEGLNYEGFVGECPQSQDNCTQFETEYENQNETIDKRFYYYIDNQRLDRSSCNGKVSQSEGCILFKNPNETNLNGEVINRYNSFATYKKYEDRNNRSITPVSCENIKDCNDGQNKESDYCKYCTPLSEEKRQNNTNDIIKVTRDRVCGEWLSCISSHLVWDKTSNSYIEECDYIGRCDELIGEGDDSQCGNIVESSGSPLNESKYKFRDTSWNGMDYSGLSIFNAYPIETLSPYVNEDKNKEFLTYKNKNIGVKNQNQQPQLSCRIYPEKDSPFKQGVDKEYYPDVNVCSEKGGDGSYNDCQCAYTKVTYGQIVTKYYNPNSSIPGGVCTRVGQGHEIGEPCDPPSAVEMRFSDFVSPCGDGGTCQAITDKTSAVGSRGFCLELDPSKPESVNACITWWPGQSLSDPETNIQSISAAYKPYDNRLWYCSEYNVGIEKLEGKTSLESCDNGSCQDQFDVRSDGNECFKDYLDYNETKGVYKLDSKYKWERDDIKNITIDYIFNNSSNIGSCSNLTSVCQPGELVKMDEDYLDNGQFILSEENSWSVEGECSWLEEITREFDPEANNQNNQDFKIVALDDDGQRYIRDRVRIKADFKNGLLDGFTVSLDAGSNASIIEEINSSGLTFKIYDATINFGQCEKIIKLPVDNNGLATVFTNRINNIKDYSNSNFDDKTYSTKCSPWGSLHYDSSWNPSNTELVLSSNNTCYDDQDKGTIWGKFIPEDYEGTEQRYYIDEDPGRDSLKQIIPQINTCWKKGDQDYYSETCSDDYKWNILTSLETLRENYPEYKLPHVEDKNETNNPFSINGQTQGTLESEKAYSAKMEFYAWVDKNAMPMRNIEIDWGGDQINENSLTQSYNVISKNYKPVCCESKEDCNNMDEANNDLDPGLNFGNIPSSCKEDFLRFERTYFCEGSDSVGWEKYGCTNACCFKPEIIIKDNWGFQNDSDDKSFGGIIKVLVPEEE